MASRRCLIIFSSTASTWPSSSVMRSSTSRCLIAASASRIAASRSFSPARRALFMSSVMRSLSAMVDAFRLAGAADAVAGYALHVALDGGGFLALALLRGLFIELAPTQLGENAGLLAGSLEAPQGGIEVLILPHTNARHRNLKSLIGMGIPPDRQALRQTSGRSGGGGFYGSEGAKAKTLPVGSGGVHHGAPCAAGMNYNFSDMRVLALESSCDESAAAVLDAHAVLLAHELFSQVELHRVYGGVVPELASRDHVRRLPLPRAGRQPRRCGGRSL